MPKCDPYLLHPVASLDMLCLEGEGGDISRNQTGLGLILLVVPLDTWVGAQSPQSPLCPQRSCPWATT